VDLTWLLLLLPPLPDHRLTAAAAAGYVLLPCYEFSQSCVHAVITF
jgi:hypothetical protein